MPKKAVVVISSHVARGSIGNRAAVFALEVLSHPVWAVPTILLPWHPGHGLATRIVPEQAEFSSFLDDLSNATWVDEIGGVLTGYMASVEQVRAAANFVSKLKEQNSDILYLCDPVIGDAGGLYVREEIARHIKNDLIPLCDVATPNRFELSWLTDQSVAETPHQAREQASLLGVPEVLITSVANENDHQTGSLMCNSQGAWSVMHPIIENPPNGPGDLTAAIYLAQLMNAASPSQRLEQTTASVLEILQHTHKRGSDELTLETDAACIKAPSLKLEISELSSHME